MSGCGTMILRPRLEILDRPEKFPMECKVVNGECTWIPAVIWHHASNARSCLSQGDFIIITGHVVKLNHTIDNYETMINIYNE